MRISRRDFLKYSAMASAAVAAGVAKPVNISAASVKTVDVGPCRFCGTGCAMVADVEVRDNGEVRVLALKGDLESPVNKGVLCTKGFYLYKAIAYKERPKGALIRKEWINPVTGKPDLNNCPRVKEGKTTKDPRGLVASEVDLKKNFVLIPWKDAINFVADAIEKSIKEHGKHSVGFYGSGQLGITETHIMNKTFKGGGGIANNAVEGQPRMCMASAVGGYLHAVGSDEPFGSNDDIDEAKTFFIIGSNTAEAHPIMFNRIAQRKYTNIDDIKIVLADPRKTRSGTIADLWLPFATGRDLLLLNAMAYVIAVELDHAKWDVEKGTVDADWKYLDKKFIERHVSFGYIPKVVKKWVHNEYGGTRKAAWDLTYTGAKGEKFSKVHPTPKKIYRSKDEIERDLYKGFAIYLEFLAQHNPDKISDAIFEGESPLLYDRSTRSWKKISGPEAIRMAAKWFAKGPTVSIWTMGVNQKTQGVWTNASIHTLHFITGQAFKPGRHSFSFTGQPSACGTVRSPGALCHALMYDRVVANPFHRKEVEDIWKKRTEAYLKKKGLSNSQIKAELSKIKIHDKPGPHTVEMFRRFGTGQIKIIINSTVNAGQSLPYSWPYRLAMGGAKKGEPWPLTVTLEAFPNATTQVSDVVLGASCWIEKEFHYGQLERRYQACKQIIRPYNNTLPDAIIFAAIMRRLEEKGIVPKGHVSQFWPEHLDDDNKWLENIESFQKQENIRKFTINVWNEMRELSKNTPHDLSGMTYEMLLERNYGYRFPLPMEYHTDPKIKERIDKYQSRIRYAYPYDPLIEKCYEEWVKKLKEWNPVYADWLVEKIEEEKRDKEYHKEQGLIEGWWANPYNANVFIHGIHKQNGKVYPRRDGRAIAWAFPWYAVEFDGKTWKRARSVEVIYRKFNPSKVDKNSANPYDVIKKITCKVPGDPDKSLDALKLIALSPAEFHNLKHAYIKPDGSELLIIDTRDYKYAACTGRVIEHWHSGSMTTRVRELSRANPFAYIEINKILAKKLGIKSGDFVIVESPRGKIHLPARVLDVTTATGGPRHDYVFIPWFDEYKLINMIMRDSFDPFSKQADYKMFAVKLYKGKLPTSQAEPGEIII